MFSFSIKTSIESDSMFCVQDGEVHYRSRQWHDKEEINVLVEAIDDDGKTIASLTGGYVDDLDELFFICECSDSDDSEMVHDYILDRSFSRIRDRYQNIDVMVFLHQFEVNEEYRNSGLGAVFLEAALRAIRAEVEVYGNVGFFLKACAFKELARYGESSPQYIKETEKLYRFYKKFGFIPLSRRTRGGVPVPMFCGRLLTR